MPELPEVEVMVQDLAKRVVGRRISLVEASFPGSVVWPSYENFVARVTGTEIVDLSRRGKYAIFGLSSDDVLIVHRGMTGSVLLRTANQTMEPHVRLLLALDDGFQLRFNDPRKFGRIYLVDKAGSEHALPWARMGPEPLNGSFTLKTLQAALKGRTALIKPLLLNQQIVAGLGNIYADEALHRARIHPTRRANTLKPTEIKRLHEAIPQVLAAAVEGRGTTFSNYTDVEGRAGLFQGSLQVFHRQGRACARCGTTIVKLVVGGRGTHVCPRCQKA